MIGADLKGADLSRTDLTGAHLYGADLQGANLFKANLYRANLRTANLVDCNLLGANLEETKLENAIWGKKYIVINEKEADKASREGNRQSAKVKYKEAEEVYRNLKISYRLQGQGTLSATIINENSVQWFFLLHRNPSEHMVA